MKRILIIYTGGTMGMMSLTEDELDSTKFVDEIFQYLPDVKQIAKIDLVSPFFTDSSNIGIPQWRKLGQLIDRNLNDYDGFVIIHGTDTMAYTACALSFTLHNLSKPVILTGSQRPLSAIRTDARGNLVNAIEIATHPISEVCVYFQNKLYRGNRVIKTSSRDLEAFESPNYPLMGKVGLTVTTTGDFRKPNGLFQLNDTFDDRVLVVKVLPSLNIKVFHTLLESDTQIFVLEAFGIGNIPIYDNLLPEFIGKATELGRLIIVTTQCISGSVDLNAYEAGQMAQKAGAIGSGDMTLEATVVKAMFLLGHFKGNLRKVKSSFLSPIAGEISE